MYPCACASWPIPPTLADDALIKAGTPWVALAYNCFPAFCLAFVVEDAYSRRRAPRPAQQPELHTATRSSHLPPEHLQPGETTSGPPSVSTKESHAPTPAANGIAYSRHELVSAWHSASREVSPLDVRWHGKDVIQANYLLLHKDGKIEQPDTKLDKQAVIERFGLLPRDLRSLDAHILDVRPALIVAQKSLIFCSPVLRAIIAPDLIVLIGTDKENPICDEQASRQMAESVQSVMKYLEISGSATGPKSTAPFELRALEALLLLTVRGLRSISVTLQERVYKTIPQLRFGVSPAELRDLLECKRTVEDCLLGGRSMQSALAQVLADDEDLADMYISDKLTGFKREVADHQQAELLLEYYERRLDETSESCERLSTLLAEVDSNISLVLASTRVRLQNLELQTAIGTLALGAGATVAGFFGMNLTSGLEEHPTAFYWTAGGLSTLMLGITAICYIRLIRARRSQLFLRSALRPRQDEDLTSNWRAGPVQPPTTGDLKQVKQNGGEKQGKGDGKEKEVEEPMKRKDGTQL
ncbi:magnesium ion transporter [Rhodosporidiobolus nylandii]